MAHRRLPVQPFAHLPVCQNVAPSGGIWRLAEPFCIRAEWRMLEWSDLRIFLAVARAGSTLRRRARSRAQPDHRQPPGAGAGARARADALRPPQHRLLPHRARARALRGRRSRWRRRRGLSRQEAERLRRLVSGVIRITAPETMFTHLLAPIVVAYRKEHPEVQIEQVSSELHLDIEGGEVDLAFRATESRDQRDADRPAAARPRLDALLQRRPTPPSTACRRCPEEIRDHAVHRLREGARRRRRAGRWLTAHVDPARIVGAQQRGAEHAGPAARLARRRAPALRRGRQPRGCCAASSRATSWRAPGGS